MLARAVILAVAVAAAFPCWAFGLADDGPRELIEAYRAWKLGEILDLSEEEMPVFFSRLREAEARDAELREAERQAVENIADLLDKEGVDDAKLKEALDGYRQVRDERLREVGELNDRALSMLTTKQRCRYVVFDARFRAQLRDMIGRARDLRRGAVPRPDGDFGDVRRDDGNPDRGRQPGGSGKGRR